MNISFVKNCKDNVPQQFDTSWQDLIDTFREHSQTLVEKDGAAIIGASFREGGKRCLKDVEAIHLFLADIELGLTPQELREKLPDVQAIIYSTWSHGTAKANGFPRFRAAIPLSRPISPDEYRALFQWAQERTGNSIDPATSDPCRLNFTPRKPNPAATKDPFFDVWEGEPLDVDNLPDGRDLGEIQSEIQKAEKEIAEYRAELAQGNGGGRPGDDFDARGDVLQLLLDSGATVVKWVGTDCYLERPGGSGDGHNAILHYNTNYPVFVNFSPNWKELWEPKNGKAISVFDNFGVYARLKWGGDLSLAAAALRKEGYGEETVEEIDIAFDVPGNFEITPIEVIQGKLPAVVVDIEVQGKTHRQTLIKDAFIDNRSLKKALEPIEATWKGKISQVADLQEFLTRPEIPRRMKYDFTGWKDGEYYFPGIQQYELPESKLASYQIDPHGDPHLGFGVLVGPLRRSKPDAVTLPLIATLALAPAYGRMRHLNYQKYMLHLTGPTGALKTTLAKVAMSCFGDFTKEIDTITWQSTVNSIERMGNALSDCCFLIDDYKKVYVATQHGVELVHRYADATGRDRMRPDTTLNTTFTIKGWIVSTGEDFLTGEPATLARCLLIHVPKGETWNEELGEATRRAHELQFFMADYIEWLKSADMPTHLQYKEAFNRFFPLVGEAPNANRVAVNCTLNSFGMKLLINYALDRGFLSKGQAGDLLSDHLSVLDNLAAQMGADIVEQKPAGIFLNTLSDLLTAGKVGLSNLNAVGDAGGFVGSPIDIVGYFSKDVVFLLNSAFDEVYKQRRQVGDPINFSVSAIRQDLDNDGLIFKRSKQRLTTTKRLGGKKQRVTALNRKLSDLID